MKGEVRVGLELAKRRGWPLEWYRDDDYGRRPGRLAVDLDRFVRSYPNPLWPPTMALRLEPHLRYDGQSLVELAA
jgi:hypothetical protein